MDVSYTARPIQVRWVCWIVITQHDRPKDLSFRLVKVKSNYESIFS